MSTREPERGSIGGAPLFVLGVLAVAIACIGFFYLPDDLRSDPSYAAVAAHVPTWLKVACCIAIYVVPVTLAAFTWEGFGDDESAIDKVLGAASAYLFAPAGVAGALFFGSFWWLVAGIAAGVVAGYVLAAVLGALLRARLPADGS